MTSSLSPVSTPRGAGVGLLEPDTARPHAAETIAPAKFLLIAGQLAALVLLVDRFNIESEAFFRLMLLTGGGFAVHYFLPLRARLPFFVGLSMAAIVVLLGAVQGAWLIGLGLAIIGLCHLPLPFMWRVVLLTAVGIGLAVPRAGFIRMPWSAAVWPILGSMFVFRLIIYLYDRKHERQPPRLSQTLGYFFLLPNVCFPLFPVVDFKKFCRNYYDEERHRIYQVGVEWIWRGLAQLLIYRVVYYHLTVDSVAVANLGDLVVYMLSTFLLYVRISGHFHLVIGMLHLFGFNLPETHHRYFLASSFTDFWRRINIYWKDFMLKVFYYPAFFRLRKLGDTKALVLATAFTFVVTWVLHLAQWFWIRGSVLIERNDIIFWTVFGLLVVVNSVYETRHAKARTLKRSRTPRETAGLALRTAGTFAAICVLWSFWTAESVSDWLLLVSTATTLPSWTPSQFLLLATGLAAATMLAGFALWKGWGAGARGAGPHVAPWTVLATSLVLAVLTIPAVAERTSREELIASIRSTTLNRRDAEQFQRGYYENLLDVGRFNRELADTYEAMPADFVRSLGTLGLARATGNEQEYELAPLKEGRFVGAVVRTNRSGMRDKEYEQKRPPGTYRMALLGPSTAMGSGVEQHETFEALVEETLNETPPVPSARRVELLNFGTAGYTPLHMLYQLERTVLAFEPDMAIFLGHVSDLELTTRHWIRQVKRQTLRQDPFLQDLEQRTGIRRGMGPNEARRRVRGHERDLLRWTYDAFVARCTQSGVTPVFVYLQSVPEAASPWSAPIRDEVLGVAREAGFLVLDLTGVYQGHDPSTLWISRNDVHPNALGSRLIAEKLTVMLRDALETLPLSRATVRATSR